MSGATTRVDVVRPDDPAWDAWLERAARDIFHGAGYHAYSEGSREGSGYLAVVHDDRRGFAWPYLLRPITDEAGVQREGLTDVHSVYGYPGPLAWNCAPGDAFIQGAWAEIQALWRSQGAVTAFTRFHPILGNASLASGLRAAGPETGAPEPIVAGGRTVSVDLTHGYQEARAAYGRGLRREIDGSRRAGLETEVDTEWRELATFARLYNDTMARLHATDFYLFQEEDFRRLREALGDRLHLLVTRLDGTVAAAGLFTEVDGLAEWYLVGTDSAYAALSPSKALVDFAIEWAIERGSTVLHLGGGRGSAQDSLLWFKSRFSPRRHTFHTGRWVLDAEVADGLAQERLAQVEPGMAIDQGYFPVYRAPLSPASGPGDADPPVEAQRPLAADASGPNAEIRISRVVPDDAAALGDLFANIDGTYFQPHPMTYAEATRICALHGKDVFLIGMVGPVAVAYGMLRGWDEGFVMPSLGLGVRRSSEGQGYGRAMLQALHAAARAGGTDRVRLRVHPLNTRAAEMYRAAGYQDAGIDRHETVMILDL
ncbi:MAG TPA: GNAT family N-acetyltransferase [Candidatus Limnocylindrales bacterium]|nr:GNAT family N-acetyltransferase [Candidatus Limnocylindrales bacterium]